jgi:cytochrome c oxidase cbb3-type subunit 4
MDIDTFRGLVTLVVMLAFIGIWIWAWSRRRHKDFDRMASLPLEEDTPMAKLERENT